jgi:hypothetical protein
MTKIREKNFGWNEKRTIFVKILECKEWREYQKSCNLALRNYLKVWH